MNYKKKLEYNQEIFSVLVPGSNALHITKGQCSHTSCVTSAIFKTKPPPVSDQRSATTHTKCRKNKIFGVYCRDSVVVKACEK